MPTTNDSCEISAKELLRNDSIINLFPIRDYERYNLSNIKQANFDAYRIWFFPTEPKSKHIVSTISRKNDYFSLNYNLYNTTINGIKSDSLNRDEQVKIKEEDWHKFEKIIDEYCFWTSPCFPHRDSNELVACDAPFFLIEGRKTISHEQTKRDFHFITRSFCDTKKSKNDFEIYFETINLINDIRTKE